MQVEKCIEEIESEIILLNKLFESHQLLFEKIKISDPDTIELSATAAVLHSFYNGLENIFSRIAKRIDNEFPNSRYWHQELLEQMTKNIKNRPEVITKNLSEKLTFYLGFRHFFRHAYAFQLKWTEMKKLVDEIDDVYNQFKNEIQEFKQRIKNYGT